MKPSVKDFSFLRDAGFKVSYQCLVDALKFYDSDPSIACGLFRKVLESEVSDMYRLLGKTKTNNLLQDINNLGKILPRGIDKERLIHEMHNVRIIGNAYNHYTDKQRDAKNDKNTCYLALRTISSQLVKLKSITNKKKPRFAKISYLITLLVFLLLLLLIAF